MTLQINQVVKITSGKHAGYNGQVRGSNDEHALVDFGGSIDVNDPIAPDTQWVKLQDIVVDK